MTNQSLPPVQRFFITSACVVILLWGLRMAAPILDPILLALFLAYSTVPVPNWFVRRLKVRKWTAIALTVVVVIGVGLAMLYVGSTGAILAIPLTMVTRKFFQQLASEGAGSGAGTPVGAGG